MDHIDGVQELRRAGEGVSHNLLVELWHLLRHNKKWWLLPIVVVLLVVAAFLLLGGSAAAPFIYTLF